MGESQGRTTKWTAYAAMKHNFDNILSRGFCFCVKILEKMSFKPLCTYFTSEYCDILLFSEKCVTGCDVEISKCTRKTVN